MSEPITELGKLNPEFLKKVIGRTVLAIAIAVPAVAAVGEFTQHVKNESRQEYALQRANQLVPQAIFDITELSAKAPADLEMLKQVIQAKRSAMDEAVHEVGKLGRVLGWDDGAQRRSEAYGAHMEVVQTEIDEMEKSGWQPSEYVKNRTVDQRELDDILVNGAQSMYENFIDVQPVQFRS
jgi:hypothetical protein